MENNTKPCPNCGQNIANIAVICPNCNYDFLNPSPVQAQQTKQEQEIAYNTQPAKAKPSGIKNFLVNTADKTKELVKAENQKRIAANQLVKTQASQTHMTLQISNGFQQLHIGMNAVMYQRPDGSVYFNKNINDNYMLLNYIWNGPRFDEVTNSVSNTNATSKTKGKAGKMTAGAIIGTALMPGVGTAVGAAIGASGKKKKTSQATTISNTVKQNQEVNTPATLNLKNVNTGEFVSIVIVCNTIVDSQIKCFRFTTEQSKSDLAKDVTDSLKGIKALKELLDMGAITQEEFDAKKQQILNN